MAPKRAGVIGAAGYTGAELVRLITSHPDLDLCYVAGRENAGRPLWEALPATRGTEAGSLQVEAFEPEQASELAKRIDVAFCALPHGASSAIVGSLY
jgi:N-acetyl-gamma-glutamylphosphate reductase